MTEAQKNQAITSIEAEQAKVDAYDAKAEELEGWQKFVDNVAYVNFITAEGDVKQITDPDMLTKANAAVGKEIIAIQSEIDSI